MTDSQIHNIVNTQFERLQMVGILHVSGSSVAVPAEKSSFHGESHYSIRSGGEASYNIYSSSLCVMHSLVLSAD